MPDLTFESHGVVALLSSDKADLLCAAAAMLPPGFRAVEGNPIVRFGLDSPGAITVDGKVVRRTKDRRAAVLDLASIVRRHVAEHAPSDVFVHAGVVAVGDCGIVVPGPSHSGKTALVAELVARGATYYSDEYAVVDAEGMIHPFAKPLTVRSRTGDGLAETIHVDAERLATRPIRCGAIVIAHYREGATWQPSARPCGEGAFALLKNTVSARRRPVDAMRTAAALARHAVVLAGERGEACEASSWLLARLDMTVRSE